jgi:hypothetical protein
MLRLLWRLTRGYRLTPWRSPYLKWRVETYSGIPADRIKFHDFWRFSWVRRFELWNYLRWGRKMNQGWPFRVTTKG